MKRSHWRDRPALALAMLVCVAVATVASPRPASSQGEPEPDRTQECCLLLLVPVGARASAVGGTLTARTGPDAVFRNPAGLAGLRSNMFIVHHSDMSLAAQIDAFSLLLAPSVGTVGISYQLFDKGEITTTDVTGQPIGELALRDHFFVASFATDVAGGVSGGLSYKVFQQRIDCTGECGGEESRGTTQAVDVGVRYAPSWLPELELGLAMVNLGFPLQIVNEAQPDAFPARLHLGVGLDVLGLVREDSLLGLRALVDLRDSLREPGRDLVPSFGLEFDMQRIIFLRAGYAPGEGLGTGAAVGMELRYDRFDVALARSFVNSSLDADTEPFQVSFGINF